MQLWLNQQLLQKYNYDKKYFIDYIFNYPFNYLKKNYNVYRLL